MKSIVYRLDPDVVWFPDPTKIPEEGRDPSGIIAVGGDLSPNRLLTAYLNGIFPWTDIKSPLLHWYCPMDRFVIFPAEIHISHSMRNLFRKDQYAVTVDKDFHQTIYQCAEPRIHLDGAWLGIDMINAFKKLHEMGYAHSVEVWDKDDNLVGGLYGLYINGCFIGESMFSKVPSGSKVALISLACFMCERGGKIIDCQMETPHLKSMGGRYIPYEEYMRIMHDDPKEEN